ncbi:MAG: protein O-mannosyl-transferase family [Verrucomicrobiota bacterium]
MATSTQGGSLRGPAPVPKMTPVSGGPALAEPLALPGGRLFRAVDWMAFLLVSFVVMTGYLLTIAPDLTLEDSGELAVASMYAGVPHPPGYPVWTVYTWLFTKLLPFSNIAWRVAVSSAFAAAMSAGLVALLASRGASLMLDAIDLFKNRDKEWDSRISLVSGYVAGMLLGFNGYIWSQAVIVEVYTIAVWSLMAVLLFLMRYTWAPHQRRHLYLACFLFGICLCNHQTLIVGAMGLEVIVLMADRRVGRDFLLVNALIWILGLVLHGMGKINTFVENPSLLLIFNGVGILSAIGCGIVAVMTGGLGNRLHVVLLASLSFAAGALLYFYMPVASSTNPPLNWGYPRTPKGFVHALTRGQYEKTTPGLNLAQLITYFQGVKEEFNWANTLLAVLPFAFLKKMRQRERGWLVGLLVSYVCLAFLLMYLLNAGTDKQSRELVKVFYTSSHVFIALGVGYGLALLAGLLQTDRVYREHRTAIGIGLAVAVALNLYQLSEVLDPGNNLFPIPKVAAGISLSIAALLLGCVLYWKEPGDGADLPPSVPGTPEKARRLAPLLAVALVIPVDPILDHWADNEQRDHYFGFWFGHDMFEPGMDTSAGEAPRDKDGKPLYPSMDPHTVLFGGTDPGRFCPTYMIFCESFIPPQHRRNPKFDRRDVYLITQNALADDTYLEYIRAHYNRSAQKDPAFFESLLNDDWSRSRSKTNVAATLMGPVDRWMLQLGDAIEKDRRVGSSYFTPSDLKDLSAFQSKVAAAADPLSAHLKAALGTSLSGDASGLAKALNQVLEGPALSDSNRVAHVKLTPHVARFVEQKPAGHTRVRLNRLLLEEAYPGLLAVSQGGVYPDREIITPTVEDLRRCFEEYSIDAQRRAQLRQLKPGEVLTTLPDGKVSVSGQAAVMSINGLLTKVIFDANPDHSFYVEESFALEWMYPHLVPYGIILKIEREPVAMLSDDQIRRDHEYWSQYSKRFIGNWITYDTPVKQVCDFALRTYRLRDYSGFQGDPRFVRDDNAQKAFSKLRNAIGKSVYVWRSQETRDTNYQAKLLKEAEFALKQAFAFCPYSPETVYNFASLLVSLQRYPDAYEVVSTCSKIDPDNAGIRELLSQLEPYKNMPATPPPAASADALRSQIDAAVTNLESAFNLASSYFNAGRSNEGLAVLETLLAKPDADPRTVASVAQAFQQLQRPDKLEAALERFARLTPDSAESWYRLASVQALQGKSSTAAGSLAKAFKLNDAQRATNAKAPNLREKMQSDPAFDFIRPSLDGKP